jgi:uncharacterized membrane protein YccC
VPASTCRALDQLQRPELSSHRVADALLVWQRYTRTPRDHRRWEQDYDAEWWGEDARTVLERAIHALERRQARPLRTVVDRLDRSLLAMTVPDPTVDPNLPWWQRRDKM